MKERILKLADGNIGALSFLNEFMGYFFGYTLERIEMLDLKGDELYMLWNDCCDRDSIKVLEIINRFNKGEFTKEYIHLHVKGLERGKKFEELEKKNINEV